MQELEGDKRATREINYARNRWRKTGDKRERQELQKLKRDKCCKE